MCDSFWNIFWMANIFQNLGWVKWIINLEICRRDQPDQKMIDHVSGLSWNLPFCSWAGGWNKVSWWVFVWEGYGNQIFDMLTSRYQPVYMAVCIGLATFIFSQLVNLHWWDSGKNASFFSDVWRSYYFFLHFWSTESKDEGVLPLQFVCSRYCQFKCVKAQDLGKCCSCFRKNLSILREPAWFICICCDFPIHHLEETQLLIEFAMNLGILGMRQRRDRDDGQPNDSSKGEEGRDAWQVVVLHGSRMKAAVVLLGKIDWLMIDDWIQESKWRNVEWFVLVDVFQPM